MVGSRARYGKPLAARQAEGEARGEPVGGSRCSRPYGVGSAPVDVRARNHPLACELSRLPTLCQGRGATR